MDDLAARIAEIEKAHASVVTVQEYQAEDIRALKAENRETLRMFHETRTSLELLRSQLAASDRKHTNESEDIKNVVDRWVDLAFKLIVIAASGYITVNMGGVI